MHATCTRAFAVLVRPVHVCAVMRAQLEADAAASRAEAERVKQLLKISDDDRTALHEQLNDARLELEEMRLQGALMADASPRSPRIARRK
jgi:hypothetical protein